MTIYLIATTLYSSMANKNKKTGIEKFIQRNKEILISIGLVFLVAVMSISAIKNYEENKIAKYANWGDGTQAFYEQMLANNGEWERNAGEAIFDNEHVRTISQKETENILVQAKDKQPLAVDTSSNQVLGSNTAPDGSEKWIEVDLSDYKLYAWEGNRKVYEFLTSTGRPGYDTPPGEYKVWRKVLSQRYKGGTPGTSSYYNLPNVPYSLFFGGSGVPNWKGYAIHGAYWHNDFGQVNRSSGCVNLKPEDAGVIYSWAGPTMPDGINALNSTPENDGIRVVIHE